MDSTVIVAIVAAAPSLLAIVVGLFNRAKLQEIQINIDGRLTELLETAKRENEGLVAKSFLEGKIEHLENGDTKQKK